MQVTARINKEHDFIELFFYDDRGDLTAYSFREGHGSATLGYMRSRTEPAGEDPRAEKLFKYWCGLPGQDGHKSPMLVKRLTR